MRHRFQGPPAGRLRVLLALVIVSPWVLGCESQGDQRTETLDPFRAQSIRSAMPVELAAALDSGSAAFRADDFEAAAEHYERAVMFDSASAPAWFGVYMAARALGRDAEAEEALQMTRELAPGATILHPTQAGDTLS